MGRDALVESDKRGNKLQMSMTRESSYEAAADPGTYYHVNSPSGEQVMQMQASAGSFKLSTIVEAQKGLWFCVPQCVGFVVFLIGGLAEMRRTPFDLPEAESELVAGYHTEYSGMKFAMFFLGEYVGVTLTSMMTVTLFLGGWHGPFLPPVVWFLLKTLFCIMMFILIRGSLPRPRYDQLMAFGWKVLLPLALLNLVVTGGILLAKGH